MENTGKQMLETAQTLIRKTAESVGIDKAMIKRLIEPEMVHEFSMPIRMDDGSVEVYKGFRIQHNSARGPYKGGIRFHRNVSREEVQALATLMSIKCAIAGIPYGGGKGGVVVDPKSVSEIELEKISRSFAAKIAPFIGPDIDIPAPDVNTNPKIMSWMLDEYEKIVGHKSPATFTGKPIEKGGSLGRTEATGRGGVIALKALLTAMDERGKYNSVAVQGFGNVGYYFAKIGAEEGFKIIAVSDSKSGIIKNVEDVKNVKDFTLEHTNDLLALDIPLVMNCKKEKGSLSGCYCAGGVCDTRGGQMITNEQLLELPVDILVPAALENVIHKGNMKSIKAKIIVEMANGPITEEAYEYLTKKGIIIIPDVFANSGGVIVSYLEWVQGRQGYYWTEEEVNTKLEQLMTASFNEIWDKVKVKQIPFKQAAFETAIERIVRAM